MENKYYTPTIEEFHVGFEYEYRSSDKTKWTTCIIDKRDLTSSNMDWCASNGIEDVFDQLELGEIRVKYLDQSDIESLGWKFKQLTQINSEIYTFIRTNAWFNDETHFELIKSQNNFIHITYQNQNSWGCGSGASFQGIVKNKSELKLLMKQLGINENK